MRISRRHFLALLGASTAVLAACGSESGHGKGGGGSGGAATGGGGAGGRGGGGGAGGDGSGGAPPDPGSVIGPTGVTNRVLWVQGTACSGCSVSFLNRLAEQAPLTAGDVLLDVALLGHHPTLMAAAGELAIEAAEEIYDQGSYLLVVEGGIPTAMDGATCPGWPVGGVELTFAQAVTRFAERAAAIMAVGTCASWGGVAAAAPNPTGVVGTKAHTGRATLNIPGCPAHPDWIVWGMMQLFDQVPIELDADGRPFVLFANRIHDVCARLNAPRVKAYGIEGGCVQPLGCRGQMAWAPCPSTLWNGRRNWCVDANAPCIGCSEPTFPEVGLSVPISHEGE